jgi:hypothetical protein
MFDAIRTAVITVFLFLFSFPIFARDVTVTIKDFELDIPLEGAAVQSWDGKEYTCDEKGTVIINVPERQVVVRAAYPGYETGRLIINVTNNSFTLGLRLSTIMESRELVVEAAKPGAGESRTGRSVAVGAKEIAQSGEIGIIEDVMSAIKLLPGVGYTGFFNAQPSIRGGDPGDMSASLDGFYINNPYYWGGGFSIFDPRMVQNAQLSHGVYSVRYGHTISGLLEITSKKPSPSEIQFELGINSSMANFNLSIPLAGKGGILIIGRITYYDPFVAFAKLLSKTFEGLEMINSIRTAPYIRAGTISGNYRFTGNLELTATGFWGMDGIGVNYSNLSRTSVLESETTAKFDFTNYQGFFTSVLSWNPRNDMLIKLSAGTGYYDTVIDGKMSFNIYNKEFSQVFKTRYPEITQYIPKNYQYHEISLIDESDFMFNAQGRIDADFELKENLLLAAGVQEMFNRFSVTGEQRVVSDIRFSYFAEKDQQTLKHLFPMIPSESNIWDYLRIGAPVSYFPDSVNNLFTTSAYLLSEYSTGNGFLKAEIGLRMDHFILFGKGFSLHSDPVLNPRLNLDFNVFKNKNFIQSLSLSAGTGLFSSVNSSVFIAEEKYKVNQMKPNRSWTSVLGIHIKFPESISLNIEGYYKYIFDRMYIPISIGLDDLDINPKFDGEGKVWGIDVMLQKMQSRFWDGWISYSWNWVKYRDPGGRYGAMGISGGSRGDDWYFPSYHRYHNLNLILNIKPVQTLNLYIRFGIVSGLQISRRIGNEPQSYPVLMYDQEKPQDSYIIEKYYWPAVTDESRRTTPSFPLDIKFSIYGNNKNGKTRYEVYIAVENVLALFYSSQGNTSFNQYTGQVDRGSSTASYEMPIPIPSFGFRLSY